MANRYWVGGTDTWNNSAGTKWATTSGGAGGASVPTSSDDVFFDAASGAVAVQIGDYNPFGYFANCRNFDSTGFTGTFPITYRFTISGSLVIGSAGTGTLQIDRELYFNGSGSHTITLNGKQLNGYEISYGPVFSGTGTYTLQDSFTTGGLIVITAGTLNTNGQTVTCHGIVASTSTSKTLTFGSSTIIFTGSSIVDPIFDVTASSTTVNASSSVIRYTDTTNQPALFAGNGNTFGNLKFNRGNSNGSITVSGNNTFNDFEDNGTAAHSILFTAGSTQTVNTFNVNGSAGKLITINSTTTALHYLDAPGGGTISCDYLNIQHSRAFGFWYAGVNSVNNQAVATAGSGWVFTIPSVAPTVTTQAVSSITSTSAVGNGNVTSGGSATVTQRGICWNTAGTPTTSDFTSVSPGTTGAFTANMTSLARSTTYYVRAYAINSVGTSYGAQVTFSTLGFTNPGNIYSSDNVYTTFPAVNGNLTVELSKDGGLNYNSPIVATFTGSDTIQTYGTGTTELWGTSWLRSDMVNALFYIRLSQGAYSQVYKNFGFATGSQILTGIEVGIEGNYTGGTMSLDLLRVKIYYGSSILPVTAGSQAYASNGRKAGEGPGAGTGVLVTYDGSNWNSSEGGVVAS